MAQAATKQQEKPKAAKANESAGSEPEEKDLAAEFGFSDADDVSIVEIDGWYNVSLAKVNNQPVVGRLKGVKETEGNNGTNRNFLIELTAPIDAVSADPKGNPGKDVQLGADTLENVITLEKGQVIAVGSRFALDMLFEYVYSKPAALVFLKPTTQKKIGGGRSMWNFQVKVKGKRGRRWQGAAPAPMNEDDIPF